MGGADSARRDGPRESGCPPAGWARRARKLETLPRLKREMAEGAVGYTKAVEVIKVADPTNEDQWVPAAKRESRQELREIVNRARRAAGQKRRTNPAQTELLAGQQNAPELPVVTTHRVTFKLSSEQLAHFEALVE